MGKLWKVICPFCGETTIIVSPLRYEKFCDHMFIFGEQNNTAGEIIGYHVLYGLWLGERFATQIIMARNEEIE